jgi:hypothetical protein
MPRRLLAAGFFLVLIVAAGSGCRMCDHPYDYCGPVFDGHCGASCDPSYRAGSILSGGMPAHPAHFYDDAGTPAYDDYGSMRPTPARPSPTRAVAPGEDRWVAQTPREAPQESESEQAAVRQ